MRMAGVKFSCLETGLQLSTHGPPTLSPGKNIARYRDSSGGRSKVRLTRIWRETDYNRPPQPVAAALFFAGDCQAVVALSRTVAQGGKKNAAKNSRQAY